ncbi:MAG TPA: tetratricopeptide repeat protein [Anaerolineales bacterium]|nr:tetratricopeptide repeat protein [Anaerolineales bacterium]
MPRLGTYLPQDRLRALIAGEKLPNRPNGSAIFADISGFTPLTEKLTQTLGPRRGVEILSRQLNAVYGALIGEVERYGGSIISFAGDSVIAWFEEQESSSAALRAATCAQCMQAAMREFKELSLKVVITSGTARRLVVGDPNIQLIDALAGRTIARLATAERLAQKGEILIDEATLQNLEENATIGSHRNSDGTTEQFFILESLSYPSEQMTLPPLTSDDLPAEALRPWLLTAVYQREGTGLISFLTELRPAVPMFISFSGIDYDNDIDAEEKLSAFVAHLQRVLTRYEGTLLQLVIGDKGSYGYGVFGVFTAHEDDAQRAVHAALELQQTRQHLPYVHSLQTGISLGTLRVGAYGSATRHTYAALGDDVNLAARLMTTAKPDEILITGRVQIDIADMFTVEPREPISMKGKGEPQPVFAVTGISHHRATRLPEPAYRLPMVGRQEELALVAEKLNLTLQGQGQVIGITAEAGMGKSRLIAEVIRMARKRGFIGYGGAAQSSGTDAPYLIWQPIWQAFFDLDPEMLERKQMRLLEGELEDRVPERIEALPLLGLVLNLPLLDNEFTRALEPQDRKSALEVLLEDCLKSAARETPLLIVLEDLHWMDPLSHDLLETLARISENLPVCFVLAYRPPHIMRLLEQRVEKLPHFTRIELKDLTASEAGQLVRAKLAQLFPERTGALPTALADELTLKSQGNPFFIEELLNYLHDRGLNPYDVYALRKLDLPASLQSLILSRIDQLTEPQKVTLKVASIIGRVFLFSWLHGYFPSLGEENLVKDHLAELSKLDLTPLDTPEPELAYLFKHIITQEVAYESLSYATRAQLHELLARYLEERYPENIPIDVLTYHYSRSDNVSKKREYLRRSGELAQAAYSNMTALNYFEQALALSPDPDEAIALHINSGRILQLVGKRQEAIGHFQQALQIATANQLTPGVVQCETRLGHAWTLEADYPQAVEWLEKAHEHAIEVNDLAGICDALAELGIIHWRLAEFEKSAQYLQGSIDLARQRGDRKKEAYVLSVLGQLYAQVGNFSESHKTFEAGLALAREIRDKRRVAGILNNYATTYYYEGNYELAQALLGESLAAVREIGDKRGMALSLNNLGNIFYLKNDFSIAQDYYRESLKAGRESDDKYVRSIALSSLGITLFRQGKLPEADSYYQESLALNEEMGDKVGLALLHCYLGLLALAQAEPGAARRSFLEGLTIAHQSDIKHYMIYNLIGMASLFLLEGKPSHAVALLAASIEISRAMGLKIEPELQEPYDQTLAEAAQQLPENEFRTAWEAGETMDIEHAVKFAKEH